MDEMNDLLLFTAFIEFRGENNRKKVSSSSVCIGGKLQSNVADFTAERK